MRWWVMRVWPMCTLRSWKSLTVLRSCVVAGRLANLDHNLQVMLIEGGETNLNNPW